MVQVNEAGSSDSGSGGGPPATAAGSGRSRGRLLGKFHTSPNSSSPLQSPFLSCSSSSSSKAGSPPEMPRFLWNYIHSPGSKKASSIKNVSTSKVTQPQKKSVRFSLSPSESSSQSSSVGSPTRRYRPRDSRSPSPPSIDPRIQTFVRLLKLGYVPPKKETSKKTPQSCLRKPSKTRASTKSAVSSR